MSVTGIPEEICAKAEEAMQAAWHASSHEAGVLCVASAILAERERCAQVLDKAAEWFESEDGTHAGIAFRGRAKSARAIAATIRRGSNTPTP